MSEGYQQQSQPDIELKKEEDANSELFQNGVAWSAGEGYGTPQGEYKSGEVSVDTDPGMLAQSSPVKNKQDIPTVDASIFDGPDSPEKRALIIAEAQRVTTQVHDSEISRQNDINLTEQNLISAENRSASEEIILEIERERENYESEMYKQYGAKEHWPKEAQTKDKQHALGWAMVSAGALGVVGGLHASDAEAGSIKDFFNGKGGSVVDVFDKGVKTFEYEKQISNTKGQIENNKARIRQLESEMGAMRKQVQVQVEVRDTESDGQRAAESRVSNAQDKLEIVRIRSEIKIANAKFREIINPTEVQIAEHEANIEMKQAQIDLIVARGEASKIKRGGQDAYNDAGSDNIRISLEQNISRIRTEITNIETQNKQLELQITSLRAQQARELGR